MPNLTISPPRSQQFQTKSTPCCSPMESLVADLHGLRDAMIVTDRRRRSAILTGQLLLLVREYQRGRRPSRKSLKRFFQFVAREEGA
jgi:hypothetical protein